MSSNEFLFRHDSPSSSHNLERTSPADRVVRLRSKAQKCDCVGSKSDASWPLRRVRQQRRVIQPRLTSATHYIHRAKAWKYHENLVSWEKTVKEKRWQCLIRATRREHADESITVILSRTSSSSMSLTRKCCGHVAAAARRSAGTAAFSLSSLLRSTEGVPTSLRQDLVLEAMRQAHEMDIGGC